MRENYFSADFFKANRARLQTLFTGTAPIVLTGNGLMQRSTDTAYPFTQDGNFWYLTGIDEPNIILVIDKGKEYLIIPELSAVRQAFDGQQDSNELSQISGVEEVLSEKEGWRRLNARLKKAGSVAVLSPSSSYIEPLGMFTNPSRRRLIRELKKQNELLTFLDLRAHLQRMRMIKQAPELEAIKQAILVTTAGLAKVHKKFERGAYTNEFEIELDLTKHFFQNGGKGHSFEPIVAAGDKACTIHPQDNHNELQEKQPILLDVGATVDHYVADISRTWFIEPTKRHQAVHAAVVEVADYAKGLLKPGVLLREYEQDIEHFMGEKLRALGLIKNIDHDSVRQYFPHATSHFLGIDVHDVGDYDLPLEANTVLTVEPGIYIPAEGIGIRIEDDILITESGHENLSDVLSSDL
jgi:Xaa-Pro aminopeptidase